MSARFTFPAYAAGRAVLACLVALMMLSGCGGGAGAVEMASAQSSADGLKVALGGVEQVVWTQCANEGGSCAFDGTRQVRYGTASSFVTLSFADGTICTNQVFGDPAWGVAKSCWYSSVVEAAASTWVLCAAESGTCVFPGTRAVRYGTPSQYVTATFTNQVACTNAVFGDPAWGVVKNCWYASDPAPVAPAVPATPGPSGVNPPIVLNASATAAPGDVVSLQGEGFGDAPLVYLESALAVPLAIINRFASNWLAVQLPSGATGALILRVSNATGVSAQVKVNAARPLHLDALQLVPGGAFRVFGRNLLVAGATPKVTVDGLSAPVTVSLSDANMLVVTAPAGAHATSAAAVLVDNGNGSGAAQLDRTVEVVASGGSDPFGLGVGWAAAFAPFSNTFVDAGTDPRLQSRAACNGSTDDGPAIQQAIELAAAGGGGIVRVPAGHCRLGSGLTLRSRVVVQGAGKAVTELVYETNYPIWAQNVDLVGVRNLTLTNAGSVGEGALLKQSTRLFIQNVRVRLMTSRQMYLTENRHFVILNSEFEQAGSISHQGPYTLAESVGLVFEGNTTQWVDGTSSFGRVHDSYVHASRFTRDASQQAFNGGTVHSMTVDFAHRIAIVGNTFNVVNGPVTNTGRNDGETILTEGGGGNRTENLGSVASATATTLSDPANQINVDPFATGAIPENYGVAIVGGKGAGQTRRVTAYSRPTLTIDRAWDIIPDATSRYATFVWGIEKSLIKGNTLAQNPRGIWLYNTAIREVDVVNNAISEGGGIYLRTYQNLAAKSFTPAYNVLIAGNNVINSSGHWMSYINSVFVNADAHAFGTATIGVEMRSNSVTANIPNVSSGSEEYAGIEGFMNMMRLESSNAYESSTTPRLLGTILKGNSCTNCDVAVRIGTGAGYTTILDTTLVNTANAMTDWATTSTSEKSVGTVVQ